jgi:hypothetical protein
VALRLFKEGGQLKEHYQLGSRDIADQHPIEAITGLQEALENIVADHNDLTGRELEDQHPIEAITGLEDALENLENGISEALDQNDIEVVNTYNDLAFLTDLTDESFAATKDLNQLFRYSMDSESWILISGESDKSDGEEPKIEVYDSLDGQTVFNLIHEYTPGYNMIDVYVEGIYMKSSRPDSNGTISPDYDYHETNSNTITFVKPLEQGRTVVFKINNIVQKVLKSSPLYEEFTSLDNQSIIILNNSYIPGSNTLDVYVEGILLRSNRADSNGNIPTDFDYVEVDGKTIQFVGPLQGGQKITCRLNTTIISIDTQTEYVWEDTVYVPEGKRIKQEIITGDIERIINYYYDQYDKLIEEEIIEGSETKSRTYTYENDYYLKTIENNGADILTVHKLLPDGKKVFYFTNQTIIDCNHNLNSKHIHISVYVDDIEVSQDITKERIDLNNIRITSVTPISGEVVIS